MSEEASVESEVGEAESAAGTVLQRDVDKVYMSAARLVKSCSSSAGGIIDVIECIDDADDPGVRSAARSIFLNVVKGATGRNLTWQQLRSEAENGGIQDILVMEGGK